MNHSEFRIPNFELNYRVHRACVKRRVRPRAREIADYQETSAFIAAAAEMAAAAQAAIEAKAKIASPSKVTTKLGQFFGEGFAIGISDMEKDTRRAAEGLVSIPNVTTPNLALAYGGEMSADYDYSNKIEYIITVPLTLDKREVGKAIASTVQEEQNRNQVRENRKHGRV